MSIRKLMISPESLNGIKLSMKIFEKEKKSIISMRFYFLWTKYTELLWETFLKKVSMNSADDIE